MKISAIAVIALMGVLGAALADYGYGSDFGSSYGSSYGGGHGGSLGGAGYGYSYMPYYGGAGGAGGAGDVMLIGLLFVVVLLFSNNSFFNSTSGSTVTPITIVQDLQPTTAIHYHVCICPIHYFNVFPCCLMLTDHLVYPTYVLISIHCFQNKIIRMKFAFVVHVYNTLNE
ncbi:hypothetical protein MAR_014453 [Mya arenaria]|uniref:Uncharacterized protein n=1 Tax=Mya arenaria TaxID=6604 RepID=A0ABY7G5W6_MYAAR|nr:hypothetical protein MAR_014453 [Mya arenaria]